MEEIVKDRKMNIEIALVLEVLTVVHQIDLVMKDKEIVMMILIAKTTLYVDENIVFIIFIQLSSPIVVKFKENTTSNANCSKSYSWIKLTDYFPLFCFSNIPFSSSFIHYHNIITIPIWFISSPV